MSAPRITLAIVAVFAALLVALEVRGERSRTFLPKREVRTVPAPRDAFRAWKETGVDRRILLLFGRYPHFHTSYEAYARGAPLEDANFLELAIFENIVRQLYFIVPDEEWETFVQQRQRYLPLRDELGRRALHLYSPSGIPVVATSASSLPALGEDALVYIEPSRFDPDRALAVLQRLGISYDLLVVGARGERP